MTLIAALCTASASGQTRTQQAVLIDVRNVFLQQPVFTGMAIELSLRNGVVTLSGTVTSEAAKELASDKIGEIAGVRTVLNNLVVAEPGSRPAAPIATSPSTPSPKASAGEVKVLTLTPLAIIPVRLREQLNTHTAKPGDIFHGVTAMAVYQSGIVLILAKTPVTERVVTAKAARPFVGYAQLSLELTAIRLPVPQVGDKILKLATLPLNSSGTSGNINSAGSIFGNSNGAQAGAQAGTQAGTQIIVQPETMLNSPLQDCCSLRSRSGTVLP